MVFSKSARNVYRQIDQPRPYNPESDGLNSALKCGLFWALSLGDPKREGSWRGLGV